MLSISAVAEFIAARQDVFGAQYQLFDLSKASPMLLEMQRQHAENGEWIMATPLPAAHCILWDGEYTIVASQDGKKVEACLIQEYQIAEAQDQLRGRAETFLGLVGSDPLFKPALLRRHGQKQVEEMITEARQIITKPHKIDAEVDTCAIGDAVNSPVLQFLSVCTEFCAFPIAEIRPASISRPTRRRLARMGLTIELRQVSLSPARHKAHEAHHSPGDRRPLHYCRGHWRKSPSERARLVNGEMRVWIAGHWKGDPDKGVVLHNYVATIQDMNARAALITEA